MVVCTYSTAQLQDNARARVWDASETYLERARDTSVQAQNLTIKLQQDVHECHTPFCQMRDVSELHAVCVLGHVQMLPWS